MSAPRRLLLVDDEANVLAALVRALRQHAGMDQLAIDTCSDPFEALRMICATDYDVVISDFRMPHMTGVELLHALREVAPATVRMILSASTEFETVSSAISEASIFRYIPKPWTSEELAGHVRAAMQWRDEQLGQIALAGRQRAHEAALLSAQEQEALKLEDEEPGLLKVKWGPNGEVIL
jgi:two-component system probable response regulator PhcQ